MKRFGTVRSRRVAGLLATPIGLLALWFTAAAPWYRPL